MTTKVTIDTHAGWDVKIIKQTLDEFGEMVTESIEIIPKKTVRDVYIHSNLKITLKEMRNSS